MSNLSKRATVYFDPEIHRALKIRSASVGGSISELIDKIARTELSEDEEDLRDYEMRLNEPTIPYEEVL